MIGLLILAGEIVREKFLPEAEGCDGEAPSLAGEAPALPRIRPIERWSLEHQKGNRQIVHEEP